MANVWVYDIETYPNVFTFVFQNVKTDEVKGFEYSERKCQIPELCEFLSTSGLKLVGYNNVYFDYPVLHYILTHDAPTLSELFTYVENTVLKSQFPAVAPWDCIIPQLDLYKVNHYDNKNRRTSLKWLEFTLRWHKMQDLPFAPGTNIPLDKLDELIKYNINDVEFTKFFLSKCMDAILFRQQMSKFLGHDVLNYSDVKIGEYINRKAYEKATGLQYKDFKHLRSNRDIIYIKDLIPDFVSFETQGCKAFLEDIRTKSFSLYDDEFHRHVTIGELSMKFAKGGLHTEDEARIVQCNPGWFLQEKDVGSMYPKAIIAGKFYPEHLGEAWYHGIKSLYDERVDQLKPQLKQLKYKSKEYNFIDSKQNAYKLAMNGGGYGKTGEKYSWQYDPLVMYRVTFRGQLSLMMLLEKYHLAGIELISGNTDGIVIHYPKEKRSLVEEIHRDWEKMTDSILEDTFYNKIIFRDVNNYIAEIIDPDTSKRLKVKYKGCFEFDQDYHKNNSQRIVAIALSEYFINNVPVENVIKNPPYSFINTSKEKEQTSIYDYCIGVKKMESTDGYAFVSPSETLLYDDKVIRFYVAKKGYTLIKVYDRTSGRYQHIVKGWKTQPLMNFDPEEVYYVNFDYYIKECRKIIDPIEKGSVDKPNYEQLKLF